MPFSDMLPEVLERLALGRCRRPGLMPAPTPRRPDGERVGWLVNNLAALKCLCRGVAVVAADLGCWPLLAQVQPQLLSDMAVVGSALAEADAQTGRKRDARLATGLPRIDEPASQRRFVEQYIARQTKKGDVYPGALVQFGLAIVDNDRLVLTEAGQRLARLPSPVLDGDLGRAETILSPDEQSLLLEQILYWMPAELADADVILAALGDGHTTPEALLQAVRPAFPVSWKPTAFRAYVCGIIARLCDLGAVKRRWEGRFVEYLLVPQPAVRTVA